MARTDTLEHFLDDVADAIRTKKGSQLTILAENFDTEILTLPAQGTYQEKNLTINQNGNITLLPDTGYDALSRINITTVVPTITETTLNVQGKYARVDGTTLTFEDTPAYDYPEIVYPVFDTYCKWDVDTISAHQNESYLKILTYTDQSYNTSALLLFDLTEYNLDWSQITKVEFSAYYYSNDMSDRPQTHPIRKVIRNWTANSYLNDSYMSSTIYGSLASNDYGWRTCEITQMVHDWYDYPDTNLGLIIDNTRRSCRSWRILGKYALLFFKYYRLYDI